MKTDEQPIRFVSPALERELEDHAGKWVAHTKTRFIAEGDSVEEAGRRARELGFTQFLLWRLPAPDEQWFF